VVPCSPLSASAIHPRSVFWASHARYVPMVTTSGEKKVTENVGSTEDMQNSSYPQEFYNQERKGGRLGEN
jgi:hypothetical protein